MKIWNELYLGKMESFIQAKVSHLSVQKDGTVPDVVVMISLKAPRIELTDREAVRIVAVVDVSGSMNDGKLDLVKVSIQFILDQLTTKDTLGIVTFGSEVETVLALSSMDEIGKLKAKNALDKIRVSGSTNLSGGLLQGLSMIQKSLIGTSKRHTLMLFTDGVANRGICTIPEIKGAAEAYVGKQKELYQIFTFGYGIDHDLDMLKAITEVGQDGNYHFIENHESIGPQFAECLGGMLSLVVQNAAVTLRPKPHIYIKKVWGKIEGSSEDSEPITIRIGDLFSEQQKDILCIVGVGLEDIMEGELVKVFDCVVSYFDVIEQRVVSVELSLDLGCFPDEVVLNPKVCIQWHRVLTADAIKLALSTAKRDLGAARLIITEAIDILSKQHFPGDNLTPLLLEDLHKCLFTMRSREKYSKGGEYHLYTLGTSHATQRSTRYTTGTQNDMVDKIKESECYLNCMPSRDQGRRDGYSDGSSIRANIVESLSHSSFGSLSRSKREKYSK